MCLCAVCVSLSLRYLLWYVRVFAFLYLFVSRVAFIYIIRGKQAITLTSCHTVQDLKQY